EQHLAPRSLGVADDHCLAATQVDPGDRGLVGHAAREAQHIDQRFALGRVIPEAGPAQRRPQRGVVDRDDATVIRRRLVAEQYLLVSVLADQLEDVHSALLESLRLRPALGHGASSHVTRRRGAARPRAPRGTRFMPGTAPVRSAGAAPGSARRGSRWPWRRAGASLPGSRACTRILRTPGPPGWRPTSRPRSRRPWPSRSPGRPARPPLDAPAWPRPWCGSPCPRA